MRIYHHFFIFSIFLNLYLFPTNTLSAIPTQFEQNLLNQLSPSSLEQAKAQLADKLKPKNPRYPTFLLALALMNE